MTIEGGSYPAQISRREAFKITGKKVGAAAACVVLGTTVFRLYEAWRDQAADPLPENQTLTREFLSDRKNLSRIIRAAESFPLQTLEHPSQRPGVKVPPEHLLKIARQLKVRFWDLTENDEGAAGLFFEFDDGVALGEDFQKEESIIAPAFMMAFKDFRIRASEARITVVSGERTDPLQSLYLEFGTRYDDIVGMDFIFLLNKGLLSNQPNKAVLMPVRFHLAPSARQTI